MDEIKTGPESGAAVAACMAGCQASRARARNCQLGYDLPGVDSRG